MPADMGERGDALADIIVQAATAIADLAWIAQGIESRGHSYHGQSTSGDVSLA